MRPGLLLAAALLAPLAACVADDPHLPRVPEDRARSADAPRLQRGRRLFASRCAVCHKLPEPARCTADIMNAMAPEAGLKPEERAAVEAYLAVVKK